MTSAFKKGGGGGGGGGVEFSFSWCFVFYIVIGEYLISIMSDPLFTPLCNQSFWTLLRLYQFLYTRAESIVT